MSPPAATRSSATCAMMKDSKNGSSQIPHLRMTPCKEDRQQQHSRTTSSPQGLTLSMSMKGASSTSGFILGRYKIVKTIGKGTFGKVQLCHDTFRNNISVSFTTIFIMLQ